MIQSQLKQISLILALGWMVTFCNSEQSTKQPSITEDKNAIEAVSAERARAFNNSNASGIARHFTNDAILMAPDSPPQKGRKAIEKYYQSIFDEFEPQLDSRYVEIDVSGDLAYGRGIASVTLISKTSGDTLTSTAKYVNILKRQSHNSWKTTHDIWNSNGPK